MHGATGPGLYPSAYEEMLCIELTRAGILFQRPVHVPSMYDGVNLGGDLCADLLVGDDLVVEALAVDEIEYEAAIRTYMPMSDRGKNLMLNFNTVDLRREGAHSFTRPPV